MKVSIAGRAAMGLAAQVEERRFQNLLGSEVWWKPRWKLRKPSRESAKSSVTSRLP